MSNLTPTLKSFETSLKKLLQEGVFDIELAQEHQDHLKDILTSSFISSEYNALINENLVNTSNMKAGIIVLQAVALKRRTQLEFDRDKKFYSFQSEAPAKLEVEGKKPTVANIESYVMTQEPYLKLKKEFLEWRSFQEWLNKVDFMLSSRENLLIQVSVNLRP